MDPCVCVQHVFARVWLCPCVMCVHARVCICPCGAVPRCTHMHTCGECSVVSSQVKAVQTGPPGGDSGLVLLQFCPPAPGFLAEVWALELGSPGTHNDTPDLMPLRGPRWPGLLVNKPQRQLEAPLLGGLGEACGGLLCWRRGWPSSWSWPGCVPGLPSTLKQGVELGADPGDSDRASPVLLPVC